jgi:hypothetical protein
MRHVTPLSPKSIAHTSCRHGGYRAQIPETAPSFSAHSVPPVRQAGLCGLLAAGRQIPCFQQFAASCSLFAFFFALPPFVFNRFAASFCKMPGWGIPIRFLDSRRESTRTPGAGDATTGHPGGGGPQSNSRHAARQRHHPNPRVPIFDTAGTEAGVRASRSARVRVLYRS